MNSINILNSDLSIFTLNKLIGFYFYLKSLGTVTISNWSLKSFENLWNICIIDSTALISCDFLMISDFYHTLIGLFLYVTNNVNVHYFIRVAVICHFFTLCKLMRVAGLLLYVIPSLYASSYGLLLYVVCSQYKSYPNILLNLFTQYDPWIVNNALKARW